MLPVVWRWKKKGGTADERWYMKERMLKWYRETRRMKERK